MSKFRIDQFKFKERVLPTDPMFQKMRADYPTLASALLGDYDEEKKILTPGATLMVYVDGDRLKWTLNHKLSRTTLFGTFKELSLALEDVEQALLEGLFEAKNR